ncbi:molecular chaperone DnaK [Scytonema hofmannii PCC 7110]|uniref:Molecular chaperone DnaK n=1 Tax=Scytonema hofmannii PCC 7110 TaxID=128403 RepID=A0A139WYS0_9CYAN|nr:molecular chaperone DnaK [Scytonema hofmannii]KYC37578.1 molecular chaperone DnaK [Scytonema hofmannii PCC 7110]
MLEPSWIIVAYTYGGACLVGQAAKRQAITNPQNTFDSVMRFIGRKYDEVTEQAKEVSYKVLRDTQGKVKINCPVLGQQFTPEEILAQILRKLADDATQYLDAQVTQIVLTVPAYFNEIQRHAVKEASRFAGLEVLRIIPNPTAAAMAYGRDKENDETIVVFDLGGGHLSVSILEIGSGVFEVLSYSGDTQLGGNDFDQKIIDWVAQEFKHLDGKALRYYKQAWQRLREAAEKAKIELSSTTQTTIDLPWMTNTTSAFRNIHLKVTLTRQKFEQFCADLVNRCRVSVENALRDSHLDKSDIDKVILVGGSTRIPAVQQFLQQFFAKEPKQGLNIDELVALGASVEAGVLAGNITGILLLDATPLSLGIEIKGGVMCKILPRNTTTPTKKSEVFSTATDGQTSVEIHVLQGEAELASNNNSLGILRLDGISPSLQGVAQIEVIFDIDANGVLTVIAKDKNTGKEQSITIAEAFASSQEHQKYKGSLALGMLDVVSMVSTIANVCNPFS